MSARLCLMSQCQREEYALFCEGLAMQCRGRLHDYLLACARFARNVDEMEAA